MFELIINFLMELGVFILVVAFIVSLIFIFGHSDKKDNITGK